jgi:hypothetical protein
MRYYSIGEMADDVREAHKEKNELSQTRHIISVVLSYNPFRLSTCW